MDCVCWTAAAMCARGGRVAVCWYLSSRSDALHAMSSLPTVRGTFVAGSFSPSPRPARRIWRSSSEQLCAPGSSCLHLLRHAIGALQWAGSAMLWVLIAGTPSTWWNCGQHWREGFVCVRRHLEARRAPAAVCSLAIHGISAMAVHFFVRWVRPTMRL